MNLMAPRKTYIGPGSVGNLTQLMKDRGAKRAFLVTDKGVADADLVPGVSEALSGAGVDVSVFDGTEPEPTTDSIDAAVKAMQEVGGADVIVSLGGGSVMDVAKCANVVLMNGGSILDYEDGADEQRPVSKLLPHVALPTTAGTGSEATIWAVFIDPSRRFKTAIQSPDLVPDAAILDPELTITMPPHVTAGTGMDALTHAIEAFVSSYANPLTEALCVKAIELVAQNLRTAVAEGGELGARTNMLIASYMAGLAFSNSSLGIVHTLAESMGGYYRIPHGVTNALMLPHVMEFNASAAPGRFATIARLMGEDTEGVTTETAAEMSWRAVRRLSEEVGLPRTLRQVGVRKEDLPGIIAIADKWANLSGNPKDVKREDIEEIYLRAY
jgi:alcohol dehydrogenase class IV